MLRSSMRSSTSLAASVCYAPGLIWIDDAIEPVHPATCNVAHAPVYPCSQLAPIDSRPGSVVGQHSRITGTAHSATCAADDASPPSATSCVAGPVAAAREHPATTIMALAALREGRAAFATFHGDPQFGNIEPRTFRDERFALGLAKCIDIKSYAGAADTSSHSDP